MPRLLKAYRPDATTRGIWQDATATGFRKTGTIPQRASRVEVIQDGPNRGKFHVDLSLLADLTACEEFRVCLVDAFDSHTEAVEAEVRFIEQNWVLK